MWKPDRRSKKPLYQQIADDMERRILYGEYPPGSFLPSERKLAEQIEVNRSTVVQAYEELRAKGIVESSSGSGTRVSKRLLGVTPSLTPNWRAYARGGTFAPNLPMIRRIREVLRERGSIIDFASGELSPDLYPNQAIQQLLREAPFEASLGYDDPQGFLPLRETLVSFLDKQLNIRTTESSILITSGSQQSLYLITQCLLAPGDAVAIEDPSYSYSLPMFQSAGLRLFRLPVHENGIDPEEIESLFRQHRIRMIFLNPNYQNPTGSILAASKRPRLLKLAAELGIPIVEDDPFSLTSFDNRPPANLKSIDAHGSVLYVGSLSKIAASGLRVGWLIAPQTVVKRLADARQQMDFGLSVVPQWLANEFLRSGLFDRHIRFLRDALSRKQLHLMTALNRMLAGKFSCIPAQGGLNSWLKLNQPVDDSKLLEESLKRGVVFMPGTVFGSEPGYVRFSFARPADHELESGIQKFAQALHALND
ncbi:PLP-dependent aminotransferase family protein [Paenibacillus validus]|uniref:MocR-like pyridoxine biosynthesis transcription factor PdxR n=1 Tax=Paenibacillus validus TaxID=44253 RepID=UPI000FD7692D|nr:PLP-dependent aminotransferase family protein [Paenibacillus validus]MED4602818.1 PLP-dependent aminotransferase family protein [Paenibacillus validus]MED4607340.1 PLP-dependent aminotransferase family protein [Paenibacillus validus]